MAEYHFTSDDTTFVYNFMPKVSAIGQRFKSSTQLMFGEVLSTKKTKAKPDPAISIGVERDQQTISSKEGKRLR